MDKMALLGSHLNELGNRAIELSTKLSSDGPRLDSRDRDLVALTIDSLIGRILSEAKFFATNDMREDFLASVRSVQEWMDFKANHL